MENIVKSNSMVKAENLGFKVENSTQAHIINNFSDLFNDKFTMLENSKTDRIPVFNIPNISLQRDFLQLVKNNNLDIIVPEEHKEQFEIFVNYMKNNSMCVNCATCSKQCYNNKAYTQYPKKGICDLRQLYRIVLKPHIVVGEIVQETINSKNVRLNGSGEIHSNNILDLYIQVAKNNKDTNYFTYTKNYKLLEGKKLPKNLIVNISNFGTEKAIEKSIDMLPKKLNTFKAVTPEEMEDIKKDNKLSKFICKGDSCSQCRLCTVKKGITIYCEIH